MSKTNGAHKKGYLFGSTKYRDVEFYIQDQPKRIDTLVQEYAQLKGFDFHDFRNHCLFETRRQHLNYEDKWGAQGFFDWFEKLVKNCVVEYKMPRPIIKKEEVKPPIQMDNNQNVKVEPMVQFKECSMCHLSKPTTDFYSNKKMKDGVSSACKKCLDTRAKELKEAKKQGKEIPKRQISKKPETKHLVTSAPAKLDNLFSNEDIDMLISRIKPELEAIDKKVEELWAESERLKGIIKKLEARKH